MNASLPCGGYCPVCVQRISLTGAIPYIVSIGPVVSSCGCPVNLSIQGSAMVNVVVGYTCSSAGEPDLDTLSCRNVEPSIRLDVTPCGCSGKTNITVYGQFFFPNLPALC